MRSTSAKVFSYFCQFMDEGIMNNNSERFTEIRHNVLATFPTNIRRSVCVPGVVEISHSVNKGLYERWLTNSSVEIELKSLHRKMAQQITDHIDTPDVRIEFLHLDPRTTKHARASY
jgi:hypothetical protein